jgi:hypothetical protein
VPCRGTLGKEIFKKNIFFAECQDGEQSAKNFSKKKLFAECHVEGHSAKKFSKKIFSLPSARVVSTQQRIFQKKKILCRVSCRGTLGKV